MGKEDEVSLLEEPYPWGNLKQKGRHYSQCLGIVIALICSSAGFLLGIFIGPHWPGRLDRLCLEKTTIPSPMVPDIKIAYHEQNFNSTLFGTSIYRQEPSPEVDQAWVDLGVYLGVILVDEDKALKAGITKGHVKTPQNVGGEYFANVEVFHQLHCLNLLRKTSHWNYNYYQNLGEVEFENEERFLRIHADHCLDALREQLMCTADIGILPYIRVKGKDRSYPDFLAAPHMCRNFEDIRSWAIKAQIGEVGPELLHDPYPGDIVLDEIP
ncbi:hypothetical protein OIDMADRAFT_18524 [Oidiodendron maius Zn]|uniref:Cyclochlorotine biosynthesis protein O n=1 Tax=Oidiodendron maius (strain Zn) TaxID=913774 RepID=A0A0C3H4F4_OIDMZ|nr:hypothetical protein OIDMADRAFT_18524 [Oidiodendron maius Zn]